MTGMNRESEEMSQGIGRRAFCAMAAGVAAASVVGSTVGSAIAEEKKNESDGVDAGTVDASDATEAPISPAVFVIDRLETKPGDGPALRNTSRSMLLVRRHAMPSSWRRVLPRRAGLIRTPTRSSLPGKWPV